MAAADMAAAITAAITAVDMVITAAAIMAATVAGVTLRTTAISTTATGATTGSTRPIAFSRTRITRTRAGSRFRRRMSGFGQAGKSATTSIPIDKARPTSGSRASFVFRGVLPLNPCNNRPVTTSLISRPAGVDLVVHNNQ